jgi:hypothetical protein
VVAVRRPLSASAAWRRSSPRCSVTLLRSAPGRISVARLKGWWCREGHDSSLQATRPQASSCAAPHRRAAAPGPPDQGGSALGGLRGSNLLGPAFPDFSNFPPAEYRARHLARNTTFPEIRNFPPHSPHSDWAKHSVSVHFSVHCIHSIHCIESIQSRRNSNTRNFLLLLNSLRVRRIHPNSPPVLKYGWKFEFTRTRLCGLYRFQYTQRSANSIF